MDEEEEPSWLSGLVNQAEDLVLTIGGFGKGSFGVVHQFSDDESDGFENDENPNFFEDDESEPEEDDESEPEEDDILAPEPSGQQANLGKVALEQECELLGGVQDCDPLSVDTRLTAEAAVAVIADHAPPLPSSSAGREHDNIDEGDDPEETSSAVPSADKSPDPRPALQAPDHSRDSTEIGGENDRAVEFAPLERQGGLECTEGVTCGAQSHAPTVMISFSHIRDRNGLQQISSHVDVLTPGDTLSRCTHRDALAAIEHEGGANLEIAHSLVNGSNKGANDSSQSFSMKNLKKKDLAMRRHVKKKFSFRGDSTWLRPKEDPPETTPASEELKADLASEPWIPILVTQPSTSTEAGGGAGIFPLSKAGGDKHHSPSEMDKQLGEDMVATASEMEKQLGQDLVATVYTEAETGSETRMPSADYLNGPAEDSQVGAEELPGIVASNFPEERNASPDSLDVHLPGKPPVSTFDGVSPGSDVNGEGVGEEETHFPEEEGEEVGTIGTKRASVENTMGSQEYARDKWFLGSPESLVPSKRGKTDVEYPLAVMRHSSRLDDAIHVRQRKLEAVSAETENVNEGGGRDFHNDDIDDLASVPWPDKALRPYDSPIVDTALPARQAKKLACLGFGPQTQIVCSPFRRCLQTAGVVARTLGVTSVTVDLEIGERMDKVRKEIEELAHAIEDARDGLATKQPPPLFSYLSEVDMRKALGARVKLEGLMGGQPPEDESGVQAKERFIATIRKLREEHLRESPVLVVAHGDTLDAAGESLASQIVFEADYCAWAVFNLDAHSGHVAASYGIQMIPL